MVFLAVKIQHLDESLPSRWAMFSASLPVVTLYSFMLGENLLSSTEQLLLCLRCPAETLQEVSLKGSTWLFSELTFKVL